MTPEEINRTIHEAMGKCWHEWCAVTDDDGSCVACACREIYTDLNENPSYTSSWADYGRALEWAQGEGWFPVLIVWLHDRGLGYREDLSGEGNFYYYLSVNMLKPLSGSTALATFIVEHPEIFRKERE